MLLTKVTHWFSTDNWATPEYPRQFRSVSGTLAGISGMARRLDSEGLHMVSLTSKFEGHQSSMWWFRDPRQKAFQDNQAQQAERLLATLSQFQNVTSITFYWSSRSVRSDSRGLE